MGGIVSCENHFFITPHPLFPDLKKIIASPGIRGTVYLSGTEVLHSENKMPYKITDFFKKFLAVGEKHVLIYYKIYTTASNYATTIQFIFDTQDENFIGTNWGDVCLDYDKMHNHPNTISEIRNYVNECYNVFHGIKKLEPIPVYEHLAKPELTDPLDLEPRQPESISEIQYTDYT